MGSRSDEAIEDDVDEDVDVATPTGIVHHRTGSFASPPPMPPPHFNPPADSPTSPIEGITPPPSEPSSATNSALSIAQQLHRASPISIAEAAIAASHSSRPRLQALQRVSTDSLETPISPQSGASGTSTISGPSDSEGRLIEAREQLMSATASANPSAGPSRKSSTSTPIMEPSDGGFELNIINPTPPVMPVDADNTPPSPAESSRAARPDTEVPSELPPEHSWDSVWPAPGTSHRPTIPPEPGRTYFPTAPISPFITPAFSSAMMPISSLPRKPPSPNMGPLEGSSPTKRSHSPVQRASSKSGWSPIIGPQGGSPDGFNLSRRRSIVSSSPLLSHSPPTSTPVGISRHQRSLSGSSPSSIQRTFNRESLERIHPSPPNSPRSPSMGQTNLVPYSSSPKPPSQPAFANPSPRLQPSDAGGSASKPKGRPRGKSLSSITPEPAAISPIPTRPDSPRPHASASPNIGPIPGSSLPPIALPPPVTSAPVLPALLPGDDGLPFDLPLPAVQPALVTPPYVPLARPAALRRALSDYDHKARTPPPPFHRSLSITADLDKSPKRPPESAEMSSPKSPRFGADADITRIKKSPRRSPNVLPLSSSMPMDVSSGDADVPELDASEGTQSLNDLNMSRDSDLELVDEGDMLPTADMPLDVTFDDEGLNTLERIFLLAKSEFPFHRAYVARVLGDLLYDVDPCESVEYVLPLLSGFSVDEDESVKEAFASELHRILWYYFSTCRLVEDDEGEASIQGMDYNPQSETVTITSEGVDVVPKVPPVPPSLPPASTSGYQSDSPSTGGSSHPTNSTMTSAYHTEGSTSFSDAPSTASTLYSPQAAVNPHTADDDDTGVMKTVTQLVGLPPLAVNFFTPLLGSLLLNTNPVISEAMRNGLIHIIARLRSDAALKVEVWGKNVELADMDERMPFPSQNGYHSHDIRPFQRDSKDMVETELIRGIIVGMGHLSIDMPEGLFSDDEMEGASGEAQTQADLFQEQLIAEAQAGRATSMNLIGLLVEHYAPEDLVEKGFLAEVLRSTDGDVAVRAEGAVALSSLAKDVPVEHIYAMIPTFEAFMLDPADQVRASVCLTLPVLCRRIESPSYRREFAVKAVTSFASGSDDVRCAMMEMLGEVIHVFHEDKTGPPQELLEVYTEDYRGLELIDDDWDVVAAFNLPGVCLTLGPDRWHELRHLYRRVHARAGDKIMRILAASLHELAKILTTAQTEEDLLPVYRHALECDDEVRQRIYEHVEVIVTRVNPALAWTMFEDLASSWKAGSLGGWRAREQLALHLPSFLETFSELEQGIKVLDLLHHALIDPFAAVRDGVTQGIPKAYVVLGDDNPVAEKFRDMLLDLGNSSVYRQRLTFVRCLREFIKPPPNRRAFEDFFVPSLPRLSQDVVDVRLGLAQIIADLFVVGAYYGDETGPIPSTIAQIADGLNDDDSADVRDTIRNVKLDRLHHGEGVPYEISPKERPNRALEPTASRSSGSSTGSNRQAPPRRPSSEVADQMDSMQLDRQRESAKSSSGGSASTTPKAPQDPFSFQFARATSSEDTASGRGDRS